MTDHSHLRAVPSDPPGPEGARRVDLADLLARSARGDEAAFAAVYDATGARAFGLALRVVRDRAQAEEVTQEAYLELWRTSASFDPARGSAISWLLTLVHRKAVDRVRSAEAAARRDDTYHQQDPAMIDPSDDSTAQQVERSIDAQRVRAAMAELTDTQRDAVRLAYFGGYTHTEIAAMLDLPLGTAKTRIRDGLIRLRDRLGAGGGQTHE